MGRINYQEKLASIDIMIRQARISEAQAALKIISPKKIPRAFSKPYADLARRVNWPLLAIKILNPIIRPKRPLHPKAQVSETALYAALLAQIGARNEARQLLLALDGSKNPEVYFYWLYILIPEWDYKSAIQPLKKYIRSTEITVYQRLVGQINLAACYVYLADFRQAQRLLSLVLKRSLETQAHLIYGNALELQAQVAINQKKLSLAEEWLQKYLTVTPTTSSIYQLYAQKWQTVIKLQTEGLTESTQKDLRTIREKAVALENFETLRDMDYQIALFKPQANSKNLVYFGTPYKSYRLRIIKNLFLKSRPPTVFQFNLFNRLEVSGKPSLSLQTGEFHEEGIHLKPGQILHRCLQLLLRDLYQPISLGQLFSHLFPNDYFNPLSSPSRIHQSIYRLNHWFKKNNIPLSIHCKNFLFSLTAHRNFIISLQNETAKEKNSMESTLKSRMNLACVEFSDRHFTSKKLSVFLRLQQRQTQYLLRQWQKDGCLMMTGTGRSRLYRFNSDRSQKPDDKKGS